MKQSKKAILMMLMAAVLFVTSACNAQKEPQGNTEEPSTVVESESEVRGIVASVSGSTVTVDLIEVSAEGRTAQNPFTLTGESRTIELAKDTPIVTTVRGENGTSEVAAEADAISKDDILYIFYKADGSLEKVRLVQR